MLDILPLFFVFLFGTIVGSFLNCVIYRLETGGNFLKGRSFCPHCKKAICWYDLVPLFSFIFLKGKCRYCRERISWQYPLVELASGVVFVLVFNLYFGFNLSQIANVFYLFIVLSFLIVIFVYDLKHFIILDKVIYPIIGIVFLWSLFGGWESKIDFIPVILSAVGAAAFFMFIVLISRGKWMGVGDIKLAFLMGLILGWPGILVALLSAFYIGAIMGLGLMAFRKVKLKSEVPFAPFLVAGTFLALFWGDELIHWYQAVFLLK